MDDYLVILRNEFEAGEGSFLIQIRPYLNWDKVAFTRLILAMQTCCEQSYHLDKLDRWIAEGFWFIPDFVQTWTTHPNFPRVHSEEYYDKAYERMRDLAWWFFMAESPYMDGTGFDPI